jgi:hypothetical protein
LSQWTHFDPGKAMDCCLGIRYIHTLRKLPIISPNRKIIAVI